VYRPGNYAIEGSLLTVKSLVERAEGLTENAFLNRAVIQRQNDLLQPELVAFDVRKVMSGEVPDIPLKRNDLVLIRSIEDLKEEEQVYISGEVIKPGGFGYYSGMSVSDLIFLAGGFTNGGVGYRIEVSSRVKNDTIGLESDQNVKIVTLNIADSLQLVSTNNRFQLSPFDNVMVRKSSRYEQQKFVHILGEVRYPGIYTIQTDKERISDAIGRSGGLKENAYLKGAQYRRGDNSVALDLTSILRDNTLPSNLLLNDGDTLIVPKRLETVQIQGEVLNPSAVNFDQKFGFRDYLAQAGGYKENATRRKVFVTYPNGRTNKTRHFLFIRSHPDIEPGSVITVPAKEENPNNNRLSSGERIAIVSLVGTLGITLLRVLQESFAK
jgi:polysaccharide export outer membrane protein